MGAGIETDRTKAGADGWWTGHRYAQLGIMKRGTGERNVQSARCPFGWEKRRREERWQSPCDPLRDWENGRTSAATEHDAAGEHGGLAALVLVRLRLARLVDDDAARGRAVRLILDVHRGDGGRTVASGNLGRRVRHVLVAHARRRLGARARRALVAR